MNTSERPDILAKFSKPIELVIWSVIGIGLCAAFWLPMSPENRQGTFGVVALAVLYTLVYYHILIQRARTLPWVRYIPAFAITFLLAGMYYLTGSRSEIEAIYVLLVSVTGFRSSRRVAFTTALTCASAIVIVPLLKSVESPYLWTSKTIVFVVYFFAAYLSSSISETIQRQTHLTVLNQVSRVLSSTLEIDKLLELIYEELSRMIHAETYYVGLHRRRDDIIQMFVVFDEGKRYPATTIPFGNGLASRVIQGGKPLLLRRLSVERKTLGLLPVLVGNAKPSESWLGVPIKISADFTGVLVVASYKPDVFDEDDVTLLENIASQAAVALNNAQHYTHVEEQAQRDSLTGSFNHGHFVVRLNEAIEQSQRTGKPMSLIMLDIDHFKKYNDTYGHVIGDEVLCLVVQAIQAHIKQTDAVGRWGGEEFGILLLNATTETARLVAHRIRKTLSDMPLADNAGDEIPKPTVSQGIATFPDHAHDAGRLVDVADTTLYEAKRAGRDQVRVAGHEVSV